MFNERLEIEGDLWAEVNEAEEREEAFQDEENAQPIECWPNGWAEDPEGEEVRAWILGERDPRD